MVGILVGLALGVLDWRVTRENMGAVWNGLGAIPGTLGRSNQAPMRYRVLMAWIAWILNKLGILGGARFFRVGLYQAIKTGILVAALVVAEQVIGTAGMLVVALGVAIAAEFDYWSSYAELLGVGLVLLGADRGEWWWILLGGVVWGLSKETAGAALMLSVLGGRSWPVMLAGVAGYGMQVLVRLVQGEASLYCARLTLKAYNVADLYYAGERQDPGPWMSVGWTVLAVACVVWRSWLGWSGVMADTAPVGLIWLVAGWLLARARETRVFLPVLLWVGGALCA